MAANKNFRITADGRVFRQGRKRYPAGDLYVGEFVDGLREGRGTLEYTNGNRYIGEWKANVYHGFGCFVWNAYAEGKLVIKGRRYELREQHYWCVCVWHCSLLCGYACSQPVGSFLSHCCGGHQVRGALRKGQDVRAGPPRVRARRPLRGGF